MTGNDRGKTKPTHITSVVHDGGVAVLHLGVRGWAGEQLGELVLLLVVTAHILHQHLHIMIAIIALMFMNQTQHVTQFVYQDAFLGRGERERESACRS